MSPMTKPNLVSNRVAISLASVSNSCPGANRFHRLRIRPSSSLAFVYCSFGMWYSEHDLFGKISPLPDLNQQPSGIGWECIIQTIRLFVAFLLQPDALRLS